MLKLSKIKYAFQREYDKQWTNKISIVTEKFENQNIPMFTVKDYSNEPIVGGFYANKLQKVLINENTEYKMESILKHKKIKCKKFVIVKWLSWPDKYNGYIEEKEVF